MPLLVPAMPPMVVAAADNAEVIARDAADPVAAGHAAACVAAVENAGNGIDADDTAHIICAGNRPVKEAVQNFAGIVSGNAAYGAAASVGSDFSRNREILNQRGIVNIAEQAHVGAVLGDAETGDGVAATVKTAAENGDPGKIHVCEVDIGHQNHA